MIDVDPHSARDGCERGAEATLNRGVEGDATSNVLRLGRRLHEQFAAGQEAVFLQHAVFVPDRDVLAEFAERKASASWLPKASPSGRTWLMTTMR